MLDQIIAYEQGEMSDEETVEFFGTLVRTGLAYSLQGSYGRMAANLIESGHLSPEGVVL